MSHPVSPAFSHSCKCNFIDVLDQILQSTCKKSRRLKSDETVPGNDIIWRYANRRHGVREVNKGSAKFYQRFERAPVLDASITTSFKVKQLKFNLRSEPKYVATAYFT